MTLSRRDFLAASALAPWAAAGAAPVEDSVQAKAQPFDLRNVRLLEGPLLDCMHRNREFLRGLEADRLLHTFRLTAGLASSADPLGGWEKPDVELRGHFTGHFLSGCALMSAGAGDEMLRALRAWHAGSVRVGGGDARRAGIDRGAASAGGHRRCGTRSRRQGLVRAGRGYGAGCIPAIHRSVGRSRMPRTNRYQSP